MLMIRFYVDNKVNDESLLWLNKMYGQHGELKGTQGLVHDYLVMKFCFCNCEVKIDVADYVRDAQSISSEI